MERVNGCRELGRCSMVCSGFDELIGFESLVVCCDESRWSLMGHPAFPFTGQGKAGVTAEKKNENHKEKKSFRIIGFFFSSMRVPSTL